MIEGISFDEPYEILAQPAEEPDDPEWEKIGRTALVGISFVAVAAFIPAAVKKRRIYTPVPAQAGGQPAPEPAPALEIPVEEPVAGQPLHPVPRCTEDDAAIIRDIFETIDSSSTFQLTLNAIHLYRRGNILVEHNVHPFEFLRRAPADKMRSIFQSGNIFKVEGVMKGVREGMLRERATLLRHIPAFAIDMGKDPERLRQLTQAADWRGIVDYLFELAP